MCSLFPKPFTKLGAKDLSLIQSTRNTHDHWLSNKHSASKISLELESLCECFINVF